MSEANVRENSNIELSDIRKLDILLTQCESSSCENICIDCCAKLGSMEDDDDDGQDGNSGSVGSDSLVIGFVANEKQTDILKTDACEPLLLQSSDVKTLNTNINRHDVISNVPTIISSFVTSASPSNEPSPIEVISLPISTATATAAPTTKRNIHKLQKSNGCEQLSFENDNKSYTIEIQNQPQSISTENTYCSKCGGLTSERDLFVKKRYFSLDKERNELTTNLLQCLNPSDPPKGGSENLLHSRKQCSFDDQNADKSFNKFKNKSSLSVKQPSVMTTCTKCDTKSIKSPPAKKCTSCSIRSLRDKSTKSSQNSLKDTRSRKNSIFFFGSGDKENSLRIKQSSRKTSARGLNPFDEQDADTMAMLGTHIKIPEPVEAVR